MVGAGFTSVASSSTKWMEHIYSLVPGCQAPFMTNDSRFTAFIHGSLRSLHSKYVSEKVVYISDKLQRRI